MNSTLPINMRHCLYSLILLSSCAVAPVITLLPDSSGRVEVQSQVHPLFADYLDDLSEIMGPVLDPQEIADSLATLPISDVSVTKRGRNYRIEFSFSDLASLVQALDYQEFFFFSGEDYGQMSLELQASDLSRFISSYIDIGPFVSLLEYEGNPTEHLSRLQWAFSDYGDAQEVQEMMNHSVVSATIHTPGKIVYQKGGIKTEEQRTDYQIPLFQLMQDPFQVELQYLLSP